MDEVLARINEGIAGLESLSTDLERHKHNLNVIEERLDYLDALAARI